MSSSDFDYGNSSDDANWSDDNEGPVDDVQIEIENTFYEADDIKKANPEEALKGFLRVVELERAQPEGDQQWTFKSLKNLVLLECSLCRFEPMYEHLAELMRLMDSVALNDATDAINAIIDASGKIQDSDHALMLLQCTLDKLRQSRNSRLVFTTQSKLAKIYLEKQELDKAETIICEMVTSCRLPDGSEDPNKTQSLMEAYAYEIQLRSLMRDGRRMKEIAKIVESLKVDISDPRILGVIKESISQMYMNRKDWERALTEQFEAFKSYQEVGNSRAKALLKYVVLTSILAGSDINPFHSQEAKVYKDDPEIVAMMNLRLAYEANDINTVHRILEDPKLNVRGDSYMAQSLNDLYRTTRLAALRAKISPYKSVTIEFLARQLRINKEEVVNLLVQLIMDGSITAQLDEINGTVEVQDAGVANKREQAYKKWLRSLSSLQSTVLEKIRT